jgi:hypothetical protein
MTILKAAGTSPGGGEQQLPTLEEAKKIDEQIGLLRGSAPKQMAPPPFKLIGKNSSNNVYPDDKDLCKPLHQLIAERKAKDASVGSKNNNIQVRQVLRPSQLAAAAKMMMGNNSNQIEQKKRPSSLLFNKNNLQEQQQNNNQL